MRLNRQDQLCINYDVCNGLARLTSLSNLLQFGSGLQQHVESPFPVDASESTLVYSYDGSLKHNLPRSKGDDRMSSFKLWQLQHALLDGLDDSIKIRNYAAAIALDHFPDHVQIKYVINYIVRLAGINAYLMRIRYLLG